MTMHWKTMILASLGAACLIPLAKAFEKEKGEPLPSHATICETPVINREAMRRFTVYYPSGLPAITHMPETRAKQNVAITQEENVHVKKRRSFFRLPEPLARRLIGGISHLLGIHGFITDPYAYMLQRKKYIKLSQPKVAEFYYQPSSFIPEKDLTDLRGYRQVRSNNTLFWGSASQNLVRCSINIGTKDFSLAAQKMEDVFLKTLSLYQWKALKECTLRGVSFKRYPLKKILLQMPYLEELALGSMPEYASFKTVFNRCVSKSLKEISMSGSERTPLKLTYEEMQVFNTCSFPALKKLCFDNIDGKSSSNRPAWRLLVLESPFPQLKTISAGFNALVYDQKNFLNALSSQKFKQGGCFSWSDISEKDKNPKRRGKNIKAFLIQRSAEKEIQQKQQRGPVDFNDVAAPLENQNDLNHNLLFALPQEEQPLPALTQSTSLFKDLNPDFVTLAPFIDFNVLSLKLSERKSVPFTVSLATAEILVGDLRFIVKIDYPEPGLLRLLQERYTRNRGFNRDGFFLDKRGSFRQKMLGKRIDFSGKLHLEEHFARGKEGDRVFKLNI